METAGPAIGERNVGKPAGDAPSVILTMMATVDVLVVNLNEPPSLLRNDHAARDWIKVKLQGVKSNRSRHRSPGPRPLWREDSGPGRPEPIELSIPAMIPGCTSAWGASLRSIWTSIGQNGLHESFKRIPANQLITLREGVGPVPSRLAQALTAIRT